MFIEETLNHTLNIIINNWQEIKDTYNINSCRDTDYYNMLSSSCDIIKADQYNFVLSIYLYFMTTSYN
jgi:hypothetical protein